MLDMVRKFGSQWHNQQLLSWLFRFWMGSLVLIWLVSSRYFMHHHAEITKPAVLFSCLQLMGHYGVLTLLVGVLPSWLLAYASGSSRWTMIVANILAVLLVSAVALDTTVLNLYHFHLNSVLLSMILSRAFFQIFRLSWLEWMILFVLLFSIIAVVCSWSYWQWHKCSKKLPSRKLPLCCSILVVCSFFASQVMYAYADVYDNKPILLNASLLPYYFTLPIRSWLTFLHIMPIRNRQTVDRIFIPRPEALRYPVHRLRVRTQKQSKMNVLLIGIDMWRFDAMTKQITPHIYDYGQKNINFVNHISGGNCTPPGLFSLFYGLPATYWDATVNQATSPLMLDQFQQAGYKFGVFMSASMTEPPFYRNVFVHTPNLRMETPGFRPWEKDLNITNETIDFIKKNKKRPFFAFMFYNAVHDYSFPPSMKAPFNPWWKVMNRSLLDNTIDPLLYVNRYRNAAFYVDGLVASVLEELKKENLEKNTIVVITSDHGNEFNDHHLDYWGHGSNFSAVQTHVPFIVHWPGHGAGVRRYQTSHFDLVPTIMKNVLGVNNPDVDYSVGSSLFKLHPQRYYVLSGYTDVAIVTDNLITTVYDRGIYQTTGLQLNPTNITPSPDIVSSAIKQMSYYSSEAHSPGISR